MFIFLFSIILIVPFLATLLYRHNGKRQIFNLDLVQFIYMFIFTPVLFVWSKSFLYYLLNSSSNIHFTVRSIFIIDTLFTVISFYIFAAIALHSLTKTMWLRKNQNPDFDIYTLSEYFHLWWSHIIIEVGMMILAIFLSTANAVLVLPFRMSSFQFSLSLLVSVGVGVLVGAVLMGQDLQHNNSKFLRLMKLLMMSFFMYHVALYLVFEPGFSSQYILFWFIAGIFLFGSLTSFVFAKVKRLFINIKKN